MTAKLPRSELLKVFGDNPRVILAFEKQQQLVADNQEQNASNAAATVKLQDATVLTLSPNETLTNERVLTLGPGLQAQDNGPGNTLFLFLEFPILLNGGYACAFNLAADTNLALPTSGTVATTVSPGPFADDAAAATGGVAVGEMYRKTGGTMAWRVS